MVIKYLYLLPLCYFTDTRAQICMNEIMPANSSTHMDPTYNYSGWVEFYNPEESSFSIYGCYLSDDPNNPKKYRISNVNAKIPAKGYYVYWFDHNDLLSSQANFKLDCEGGELTLYNSSGNPITNITYPLQIQNTSYARTTDGGDIWGFCTNPTLGKSNAGSTFATERCPEPEFSTKGGVYKNTCSVKLTCPTNMEIRYTTNGAEPTATSSKWNSGMTLSFSKTTVLRARVMASGYIPGTIITHSYIISDRDLTLPVTSIVTDPQNLWDNTIGIYCVGTNGIPGKGQGAVNWNRDWARPGNFELLEGNQQLFSQECDIAIGGGWTRANALKSLKLNAEKKYDERNKFQYSFFKAKPGLKFKSLLLRNGGNDFGNTMISDAMQQSLVEGVLDIDYQAYHPTLHYINGEFYGIINLRERNNSQFVYSNYGYDSDSIDLIEKIAPSEGNYEIHNGTINALNQLVTKSANASNPTIYKQIEQLIDIDAFITYLVIEMYSGNWDWPVNNTKVFRHRNNGKFRWILYDLEGGFQNIYYNPFQGEGNSLMSSACDNVHTAIIARNLLKNTTFKQRFIDYFTLCLGSVYSPERVTHIIDSIASGIRAEVPYNRWGTDRFESGVSGFKNFANGRPNAMIQILKNYFNLNEPVDLIISSNTPQSTLMMNDIPVPLGAFNGYTFKNKTLNLKAIAPTGYKFERWNIIKEGENVIVPYGTTWNYYDTGSLDGKNWTQSSYTITNWKNGKAPLGYGKNDITTTLDYGTNTQNKRPTAYMRQTFNLNKLDANDRFKLYLTIDDGAIIYLNGKEVARYLMPSGNVTYNTFATTYASGNPDHVTFNLPTSAFKQGSNLLAVEIHQNAGNSTDLYLDAQIVQTTSTPSSSYENSEITLTVQSALNLQAEFSKEEKENNTPIRINEVSASNDLYTNEYFKSEDWIELYNTTDEAISVAGLYISREPENPMQYRIPDTPEKATVIPPHGYLILWADKQNDLNQLHLPFKLAGEGGTLQLTCMKSNPTGQPIEAWYDRLTYTPHTSVNTFGRYPDGSDSLYIMNRPTLLASNFFSPYSISIYNPDLTGLEEIGTETGLNETGITFYYDAPSVELIVDMQQDYIQDQSLMLYNLPGQIVGKYRIPAYVNSYTFSLADLPTGYYIAVFENTDGHKTTFKFIR